MKFDGKRFFWSTYSAERLGDTVIQGAILGYDREVPCWGVRTRDGWGHLGYERVAVEDLPPVARLYHKMVFERRVKASPVIDFEVNGANGSAWERVVPPDLAEEAMAAFNNYESDRYDFRWKYGW